jgi:hypothetical protein
MMRLVIHGLVVATVLATTSLGKFDAAGQTGSEEQVFLQFQRAADTYAFKHRQVEGRLGGTPDTRAMAAGMRAERPSPDEGILFTPLVAAAFRNRIQLTLRTGWCVGPDTNLSSVVPRPNDAAVGTAGLAECLVAALPKLPRELEYRSVGVALVVIDAHPGLVVDILHGAFPVRN